MGEYHAPSASRFIRMFNQKALPILICTSTLIEGVNTAAKSVLIYDKRINRADYDFFTFSNIRGRAGRLGQHHVGNVYLFHAPPDSEAIGVTAPLFGDLEDAPDEFVVHVEENDSTPAIDERVEEMATRLGLSSEELRRFSGIGLETLATLKEMIEGRLRSGRPIQWSAYPEYGEVLATCEIVCHVRRPADFGVFSYDQLGMYLNKLRKANSMKEFFSWHDETFKGKPEGYDGVFKFLRAVEYSLPELFSAIDLLIRKAGGASNYDLFIGQMTSWFRAPALKMLEEQGIPIQISERFLQSQDTVSSLSIRLRQLVNRSDRRLSSLESEWIADALPNAGDDDL